MFLRCYYFRGDGFGGRLVVRRVKKSKSRRALSDKKLYRCVLHANTDGCIYTDKRGSGAGASLRGAYGTVANVSHGTVAGWHVRKVPCMPSGHIPRYRRGCVKRYLLWPYAYK